MTLTTTSPPEGWIHQKLDLDLDQLPKSLTLQDATSDIWILLLALGVTIYPSPAKVWPVSMDNIILKVDREFEIENVHTILWVQLSLSLSNTQSLTLSMTYKHILLVDSTFKMGLWFTLRVKLSLDSTYKMGLWITLRVKLSLDSTYKMGLWVTQGSNFRWIQPIRWGYGSH